MKIVCSERITPGIFNFSNYGKISWFDFANKIKELSYSNIKLNKLETWQYPTPAKRPKNSTLNLEKIKEIYNIQPKDWAESLANCVETLRST